MPERVNDGMLRTLCDVIAKTEAIPDTDEGGTFGDALRAAALDLRDLRAALADDDLAENASHVGRCPRAHACDWPSCLARLQGIGAYRTAIRKRLEEAPA